MRGEEKKKGSSHFGQDCEKSARCLSCKRQSRAIHEESSRFVMTETLDSTAEALKIITFVHLTIRYSYPHKNSTPALYIFMGPQIIPISISSDPFVVNLERPRAGLHRRVHLEETAPVCP
jgi:hypothetical protein